jgi:hypothetical protein
MQVILSNWKPAISFFIKVWLILETVTGFVLHTINLTSPVGCEMKILHRFVLTSLPCVLGALLLSACGGGDDSAPGSPGILQLADISYDVTEGAVVNIFVTRSDGDAGEVSVDYATSDRTAVEGSDYNAANGTLT